MNFDKYFAKSWDETQRGPIPWINIWCNGLSYILNICHYKCKISLSQQNLQLPFISNDILKSKIINQNQSKKKKCKTACFVVPARFLYIIKFLKSRFLPINP